MRRSRSPRVQWRAAAAEKGTQKSVYTDAQAAKLAPQKLFLRISSLQSDEWTQIKEVLCTQPGDTPVYLYPMDTKKKTLAARRYWCKPDIAFLTKLRFLLREEECYNTIGELCLSLGRETVRRGKQNCNTEVRAASTVPLRKKTDPTTGRLYHG